MEKTKRVGDYKTQGRGRNKDQRDKSNLIIPLAIIGLVAVLVISYNLPWSELVFSKIGTAKPYEKLNPELTSKNISREQAIDIATNSSVIKELWRATTPYWYDPLDTDTGANTPPPSSIITELIQDNARSYIRWVVANASITVWVDAKNGEIIHYSNYDYTDGDISEEEAVYFAEYFTFTFNPMPSEAILYRVERWCPLKAVHWSASDGSILETSAQEVYTVIFSRTKNDVPSDDRIEVWISTSGGLVRYQKTWTLIMPEETEPQKTRDEAIDTAKNIFDGTVNDITLMIRRPNYYWSYGEYRYGITEGKLCWVIALTNEEDIQAEVWVDAINGKIVGGTVTL